MDGDSCLKLTHTVALLFHLGKVVELADEHRLNMTLCVYGDSFGCLNKDRKMSGGTHGQKCRLASRGDWIQGVPSSLSGIIPSSSPVLCSSLNKVEDGGLTALDSV